MGASGVKYSTCNIMDFKLKQGLLKKVKMDMKHDHDDPAIDIASVGGKLTVCVPCTGIQSIKAVSQCKIGWFKQVLLYIYI